MKLKWVGTWSRRERKLRLFRLLWTRGRVGTGGGYSNALSVGLVLRLFRVGSEYNGWSITLLGVRVHRQRSYGGIFV